MILVKITEAMHNTKNSFLKMLKIYLQLRNALIKSIIVLKMETKNLIKNGLGKNSITSICQLVKPMKICCNYAFCLFLSQQ